MKKIHFIVFALILLFSCTESNNSARDSKNHKKKSFVPNIEYSLIKAHPHDITSFTEGLVFYKNQLHESTGSPENLPFTKSLFGIVDLNTGKIDEKGRLNKKLYFGEGIAFLEDKLYQLTYLNQTCFIYDAISFEKIGKFYYENKEGWGLTTDGKSLIMSDGTNVLTYLNKDDFQVSKRLNVAHDGYAVDYMNELEFIKGYIYANVWTKSYIVKIDTVNGNVVGILHLNTLFEDARSKNPNLDVMNGIAYDSISGSLFVTGKMWPNIYELDFYH